MIQNSPRETRLVVRSEGRRVFLHPDDVIWIEAHGNYAIIHVAGHAYPTRRSLVSLEERLSNTPLVRIHRSTMVNVGRIRSMERTRGGDYQVSIEGGPVLRLSRNYRERFLKLLEDWL